MKKLILVLILLTSTLMADTLYYVNEYKMINCKVLEKNGSQYIVETITKNGRGKSYISALIVDVIEYSEIDTTILTKVINKKDVDAMNMTKIKNEQMERIKAQKLQNKKVKERIKENSYVKLNTPMFASGIAFGTLGIINLANSLEISKTLKDYENTSGVSDDLINEMKSDLNKSYVYGAIFTIAGIINISYSFERVEIEVNQNGVGISAEF